MHKVALVTGAAERIGRAIGKGLADAGWSVIIHYNRSASAAMKVADEINAAGGCADIVAADLSDIQALPDFMATAYEKLGPLSLLVNNASLFEFDTIESLSPSQWQAHFNVNLAAPCFLSQAFAERCQPSEKGHIVNIIDQRVLKLNPLFFSYTLSKSALWTATRTMAQALAPNIRVNAIGPGPTLPSHLQSEDSFAAQVAAMPLQTGPCLDEFVRAIEFLDSTPSMTGQMLALDGGQHLNWQTVDLLDDKE